MRRLPIVGWMVAALALSGCAGPPAPPLPDRIWLDPAERVAGPDPEWPREAREAGIRGVVRCRVTLDTFGRVRRFELISGHPLLVNAAGRALQHWRWRPAKVGGKPAEVLGIVDVAVPSPPKPKSPPRLRVLCAGCLVASATLSQRDFEAGCSFPAAGGA